ncbi:MAG: type II toxin-antitoxin system RelE/ParE family toxin [Defluviitaleaceae bacterium]|nr:type II toxin-antitoxin system RelE/ParE family toxin [Defluviitaleaceae bacterium]
MISDEYDVQLIDEAEADLRDIYEYFAIKRREPKLARKIYKLIMDKLNSLKEMPFRYPIYQEEPWRSRDVRQVFARSYCAFYFVTGNIVKVFRIMYGGMDLSSALNETKFDDFY